MARDSQIVTISLPKELAIEFNNFAAREHMTKSELFRKLLQAGTTDIANGKSPDIAGNLKKYWELKESGRPTILIGSVIVSNKNGQVIILKRSKEDKHIKHLTWVFPGAELKTLDFNNEIVKKVKDKTGIVIKSPKIIGARVYPESLKSDITIITLYFGAEFNDISKINLDETYSAKKFIKPLDIYSYFSTSTSDEINRYLVSISK